MSKKTLSFICILLSGILWGTMGYFRRGLGDMGLQSFGVVFVRCALASVLLLVTVLVVNPSLLKIKAGDIWCFIGSGIISMLFFSTCYFEAMNLMSLAKAAILLYTAPAFVIILSALIFRDKITPRMIAAMILTFAGICLVSGLVGDDTPIGLKGLLFGLGSGFGYALYTIFSKLAMKRGYESLTISFYSLLFAAAGAGIIWGVREPAGIMFSSGGNFLFCLIAALVTGYLPYILYTYGLTYTPGGRASLIASIEPVVAALVGVMFFGEKLTLLTAAGTALVLAGIVICSVKANEKK